MSAPATIFYVEVKDIVAALAEAEELGGKKGAGPIRSAKGFFAWFSDPDGNTVGLVQGQLYELSIYTGRDERSNASAQSFAHGAAALVGFLAATFGRWRSATFTASRFPSWYLALAKPS